MGEKIRNKVAGIDHLYSWKRFCPQWLAIYEELDCLKFTVRVSCSGSKAKIRFGCEGFSIMIQKTNLFQEEETPDEEEPRFPHWKEQK